LQKPQNSKTMEIKGRPIDYAKSVTKKELKAAISEIKHGEYNEYLDRCRICFEEFLAQHFDRAEWWSNHADNVRPE